MNRKIDPTIAAFAAAALSIGAGYAMTDYKPRRVKTRGSGVTKSVPSPKRAKNRAQKKARKATRKACHD